MATLIAVPRKHDTVGHFQLGSHPWAADRNGGLSRDDFAVFVRDYSPRLLGVARRFLNCDEDAADAVQDALLAALQSLSTFQGDATVYTWLYRIVVNVCLMRIRSRLRAKVVALDELSPTVDGSDCQLSRGSRQKQAAQDLEREETRTIVRDCIDRLPADYRTILVLRDIEQFDTDQTAELLDLSRAAVKTRLHRARQALRALLEPVLT
jgi:RNA polymerase sigma-70 factor (ECF subfamily)